MSTTTVLTTEKPRRWLARHLKRDDDFVPQPECVAVGLASAKVRAQICNSLSTPLAR